MSAKLGVVCVQLGPQKLLRNRGFLSTILIGDAVGIKERQGGYKSGVIVQRGSTVVSIFEHSIARQD